jgi:hypothetical protein
VSVGEFVNIADVEDLDSQLEQPPGESKQVQSDPTNSLVILICFNFFALK